ncbi:NAD(P)/FAD-dependent oxidoreductase [Rhodococcus sp. G-MC3]|uniref:NAD(P)/FAD-dependent oxidoreductase n=1 Tax=Rhodococcus sp. G-MC3 TaxID=3046209 RepID=UPI0024BBE7D8|nr:NAD(P)/FAD-dependent oxidoreductase [Rhodococcus sp. G-MC3]MDJ0395631.1 NAD(P)/FAD-dependent oxidoreductase [Rhodococcus sp. G-MC3]
MTYDVVIVGGSAAGLSAALMLTRSRRRVAVVDSGEPRNSPAQHVHGFLTREGISPTELLDAGRAEVVEYGGTIINDRARAIEPKSNGFLVRCGTAELETRSVLVATGLHDELPDIPGVAEQWGIDVLHCPYCHGHEVRDTPIAVIGGDNRPFSVHQAALLRQWSSDIVFFTNTIELTTEERKRISPRARIIDGRVSHIATQDGRVRAVALENGDSISRASVFVGPRFIPRDELLTDLGCETTEDGWVTVDPTGRTSVPGVWAAGNVVDSAAQLVNSVAAGSKAGIALNHYLLELDIHEAN